MIPQGQQRFYQIYYDLDKGPSKIASAWSGPYRDETDAESAALDEAKCRDLELVWVD